MKIEKIVWEMGNDFSADLICEHCLSIQRITSGYHDSYYHTQVIPGMFCPSCKKNRDGLTFEQVPTTPTI